MVSLIAPIPQHHLGALSFATAHSALQRGASLETIWLQVVIQEVERAVRNVMQLALASGLHLVPLALLLPMAGAPPPVRCEDGLVVIGNSWSGASTTRTRQVGSLLWGDPIPHLEPGCTAPGHAVGLLPNNGRPAASPS